MSQPLDRKDLKIQALLEKLGSQASSYENQIADLRVELTVLEQQVNDLHEQVHQPDTQPEPQYVQGEVLSNVPQAPTG